jgi:hypothetical protein
VILPVLDRASAGSWIEKGKSLTYRELVTEVDKVRPAPSPIPSPTGEVQPTAPQPTLRSVKTNRRAFYLTEEQETALDEALGASTRISESQGESHNLYLICIKFLSDCMTQEEAPDARLRFFMRHLERVYGGRMIHVRTPEAFEVLSRAVEQNPDLFTRSDE